MQSLRLLEVAAQADVLRLRRTAEGMGRKAALSVAAALFGLAALSLLHVAAWIALAKLQGALLATLYVALGDLVIMALLLWLGRRRPDPIAAEALLVRRFALNELGAISPIGEAIRLLTWRNAAREVGGLVAERIVRAIAGR